jgi:ketosteroid isomerase-like protein
VTALIDDPFVAEQQQVVATLDDIFAAAAAKDFDRLAAHHLDGPKFTKFDDFPPLERQDALVARHAEQEGLAAVENFTYRLGDLQVDVFGPVAVSTFVLEYSFDVDGEHVALRARATMVMVADGPVWKIAHEHISPFATHALGSG